MRIVLVILAALIVAGGTGYYVMQGLQPSDAPRVVEARGPELKEVYVPAQEIAVGTIITPDRLSTMQVTENAVTGQMIVADDDGAKYLTGSVARQAAAAGGSDRPDCHRAAGRSGVPRRRAAQGHARDHHSGRTRSPA